MAAYCRLNPSGPLAGCIPTEAGFLVWALHLLTVLVLIKVVTAFVSGLLHILGKFAEEACLNPAFIIYLHDSVNIIGMFRTNTTACVFYTVFVTG